MSTDWYLEIGQERGNVANVAMLTAQTQPLRSRDSWVARLYRRVGQMTGWQGWLYRMLGLSQEQQGESILVRANEGLAAVSFLDDDFNETIVVEEGAVEGGDAPIDFDLGRGETETRLRRECVSVDAAIGILLHVFEHGTKPSGFEYRKAALTQNANGRGSGL